MSTGLKKDVFNRAMLGSNGAFESRSQEGRQYWGRRHNRRGGATTSGRGRSLAFSAAALSSANPKGQQPINTERPPGGARIFRVEAVPRTAADGEAVIKKTPHIEKPEFVQPRRPNSAFFAGRKSPEGQYKDNSFNGAKRKTWHGRNNDNSHPQAWNLPSWMQDPTMIPTEVPPIFPPFPFGSRPHNGMLPRGPPAPMRLWPHSQGVKCSILGDPPAQPTWADIRRYQQKQTTQLKTKDNDGYFGGWGGAGRGSLLAKESLGSPVASDSESGTAGSSSEIDSFCMGRGRGKTFSEKMRRPGVGKVQSGFGGRGFSDGTDIYTSSLPVRGKQTHRRASRVSRRSRGGKMRLPSKLVGTTTSEQEVPSGTDSTHSESNVVTECAASPSVTQTTVEEHELSKDTAGEGSNTKSVEIQPSLTDTTSQPKKDCSQESSELSLAELGAALPITIQLH